MLTTQASITDDHRSGRIPTPECPGPLLLVTGSALNPYRALIPDDDHYATFADVWQLQRGWNWPAHYAFWRLGLDVWPRQAGQRRLTREALGAWVFSWRRFGLSDDKIARRLGRERDSLRRRGALAYADELAERQRAVHAAELPRRWERAPLIVAVEQEEAPLPTETWCDPRLDAQVDRYVAPLRAELQRLTR
ncbi:MAG: hypothetical protein WD810_06585 [Solirubrobacterales bacterium]